MENISSGETIRTLAKEKIEDAKWNDAEIKLLSIGRFNVQKGFDIGISAAKRLKDNGIKFVWYILGDGGLRQDFEKQINELGLQEYVILPGIKSNPYPYINSCTIFVQPSRFEGKSIVLDEAKILCKPILVTNYPTVASSITANLNGRIVELTDEAVADGIKYMLQNKDYCDLLVKELTEETNSNEHEIQKYILLMQDTINR